MKQKLCNMCVLEMIIISRKNNFLIFLGFFYGAKLDVIFFSSLLLTSQKYFSFVALMEKYFWLVKNIFPSDVEKYFWQTSDGKIFLISQKYFSVRRALKILKIPWFGEKSNKNFFMGLSPKHLYFFTKKTLKNEK